MSIKIYTAYRTSPKIFSEVFLPKYRQHCFECAADVVGSLGGTFTQDDLLNKIKEIYEKNGWHKTKTFEEFRDERYESFRIKACFQVAIDASKDVRRNPIADIDCSLNIWFHKNKFYFIVYGENHIFKGFDFSFVEDFCYWNNTDPPENVTDRQWQNRRKIWDAICLDDDWDSGRMQHEIITASKNIGLIEVAKILVPDGDHYYLTNGLKL